MEVLIHLVLFLAMLFGLAIIPFGLPGAWFIFICIFLYVLFTGFEGPIGLRMLVVLGVLTLIAETADNWLTALGARRYGGSTGSMWASVLGVLAGAIVLGGPLALMLGLLGPVAGGFIGAFAAVVAYEYYQGSDARRAVRVGWGTFVGRMAGIVLKFVVAAGIVIAAVAAIAF